MKFADSRTPFKPGDEVWVYPGPSGLTYNPLQKMHVATQVELELANTYMWHIDEGVVFVKSDKGQLYGAKAYETVWPNPYDLFLHFFEELHALLIRQKIILDTLRFVVEEGDDTELIKVDTEAIQLGHMVDETAALYRTVLREWTDTFPRELGAQDEQ